MNIQSVITLTKEITIQVDNNFGGYDTLFLAFVSVNLNRDNEQCQLN